MFLHWPASSSVWQSSLRQMTLCGHERLAEKMNFVVNGCGLRDGARYLAAKSNRILLAQSMDQRVHRSFTDSKRHCCLMVGTKLFCAAPWEKTFERFEYLSFTARTILRLHACHGFVQQCQRPASVKDLLCC